MGAFKDLTGQTFGRLKIVRRVVRKVGGVLWACLCNCGRERTIKSSSLVSGNSRSCGCMRKETLHKLFYRDLVGQQFGRLTVLSRKDVRPNSMCLVKCVCGRKTKVQTASLINGHTKSCGCIQKERASEVHFKNLVGKTFGRLEVVRCSGRKHGGALWLCLCKCGIKKDVMAQSLYSGATRSCGSCTKTVTQLALYTDIVKPLISDARQEYCLPSGLRLDIASPSLCVAIEYDGYQHRNMCHYDKGDPSKLVRRRRNDRRKTSWCIANGWCLFRVPDTEYKKAPTRWQNKIREVIQARKQATGVRQ